MGEIGSLATEYAFHKNDPGYNFDWGASTTRVIYAAGISGLSGYISYELNTLFQNADEVIGLAISAETAIALGAVDFGVRNLISSASQSSSPSSSVPRKIRPSYRSLELPS